MNVGHGRGVFVINFFEDRPPILSGSAEEKQEQLDKVSEVESICIARVTITAERMEEILKVLQGNFDAFRAAQEKKQ